MRDARPTMMRNLLLAFGLLLGIAAPSCAQADEKGISDFLGLKGKTSPGQSPVEWSASLESDKGPLGEVVLRLSAKIPPDHWIYATKPEQGPETKITVKKSDGLGAVDKQFVADHPPELIEDPSLGQRVEKYFKKVTWTRRYSKKAEVSPESVSVSGIVEFQVCDKHTCQLGKFPFEVKLASSSGTAAQPVAGDRSTRFEHLHGKKDSPKVEATWTVSVSPQQLRRGGEVTVTVRRRPESELACLSTLRPEVRRRRFVAYGDRSNALQRADPIGDVIFRPAPTVKHPEGDNGKIEMFHEGSVVWTRRFKIADDVVDGKVPLTGKVAWQMCKGSGLCLLATGFEFGGALSVSENEILGALPLTVNTTLDSANAGEAIDKLRLDAPYDSGVNKVAAAGSPAEVRDPSEVAAPKDDGGSRLSRAV